MGVLVPGECVMRTGRVTFVALLVQCSSYEIPPELIQMVELLATLWKKFPDWRLGQLVLNANAAARATGDMYFTEDEEFAAGACVTCSAEDVVVSANFISGL